MQNTYNTSYAVASPGKWVGQGWPRCDAYMNDNGGALEIYEITAAATTAAEPHTISINGFSLSFEIPASQTNAQAASFIAKSIQNSQLHSFVSIAVASEVVTLTAREREELTVASTLSFTKEQSTISLPPVAKFGRFITTHANFGDPKRATLAVAGGKLAGVTLANNSTEATGVPMKEFGYRPLITMDVLDRCQDLKGIWCSAVESDFGPSDTAVYVSVALDETQGKVTRVSTGGNLQVVGASCYQAATFRGEPIALIYFNLH
jgi:hypothetical protein